MSAEFITGEVRALDKRGIEEATCAKFGYRVGNNKHGRTVQIADYRDTEGVLVAQKVRDAEKNFVMLGDGKNAPLFGQHLFRDGGLRVVVTEGEIDAMSVCQAFGLRWAAVSLPNGAQSAKKAIQRNLEWLESYTEVVLMFDMDEPGREAAQECAPLFTPGRCKIAELPLKDANEMLKAGRVKELVSAVYEARTYRPDGMVTLDEIEGRVLASPEMGRPWFLEGLTKATFGRRLGEVVGLGAGTGIGKTDFLTQQVKHDVVDLAIPTGVLFLEQSVGETGRRVAGKMAGKRFHVPDGTWTEDELRATWGQLKATNRLHLYDSWGAADWPTIKSKIRYMVCSLGVQHVYLDHMTALAAAEEDERKALEKIMAEAAGMAQGLRFHLTYVSHLATPEGKPHEEGGRVMIRHFKGSRALGYWSHFMFGLERAQQATDPEERRKTTLRCLKDRYTGQATGLCLPLAYDQTTGLLSEGEAEPLFADDDSGF